jgi:hypothetical protein
MVLTIPDVFFESEGKRSEDEYSTVIAVFCSSFSLKVRLMGSDETLKPELAKAIAECERLRGENALLRLRIGRAQNQHSGFLFCGVFIGVRLQLQRIQLFERR